MELMKCFEDILVENDYYLMHMNTRVLKFSYKPSIDGDCKVTEIYKLNLIPIPLLGTAMRYLDAYFKNRAIPSNREHLEQVIESIGINGSNYFNILKVNNALSLNDCYWICECSHQTLLNYNELNLYTNPYKDALGLVAFFGNISSLGGNLRTPEVTTQGMLSKAWRQMKLNDSNTKSTLYKRGTYGYSNAGLEPFSEYIASQIADIVGIKAVSYNLDVWYNVLCSTCDNFCNYGISYYGIANLLELSRNANSTTYNDIINCLTAFNDKVNWRVKLEDMSIFDFIIENRDRHLNNFGVLVDNKTNSIIDLAPLFDHGFSLMNNYFDSELIRDNIINKSERNTFTESNHTMVLLLAQDNKEFRKRCNIMGRQLLDGIELIDFKSRYTKYIDSTRVSMKDERIKAIKELLRIRANILMKL